MAFVTGISHRLCRASNRQSQQARQWICKRPRKLTISAKTNANLTEKLISISVNRGVNREIAERVVQSAQRAIREWTSTASDFLTPPESAAMAMTLSSLPEMQVVCWGGYEDAERTVVLCGHCDVAESSQALISLLGDQLVLLKIEGKFDNQKVSHRDFMGAVLNAGVARSRIGDILVVDDGAQVIVRADVAEFLIQNVTSVANVAVQVEKRALEDLQVPPKRVKELQSVEASMRLDAVVSAGFNISRSKLAAMSRSGLVSVNYKEVKAPAKTLKTGDVVSVRGVGKLEIGECSTTAKGRYRIEMKRYI